MSDADPSLAPRASVASLVGVVLAWLVTSVALLFAVTSPRSRLPLAALGLGLGAFSSVVTLAWTRVRVRQGKPRTAGTLDGLAAFLSHPALVFVLLLVLTCFWMNVCTNANFTE